MDILIDDKIETLETPTPKRVEQVGNSYYNLFPTPVSMNQIGRDFTKKELDFVRKQEKRPNMGNFTSADHYVLKHKELASINKFIEKCLNNFYQSVFSPRDDVEIYITQSWLNYTEPGQFHHKHAHPNSFISGVLYLNATAEKDKIYFYNENYKQIKLPPQQWNVWNSESWWLPVENGSCVVFPSHFTHMVETVESDDNRDTRISLSFNTFLKGNIGDEASLTGLRL
jgi:uncharacterized protein (TIGR02466 family)